MQKEIEDKEAMREKKTSKQLKLELVTILIPKETVAGAIRRLSGKGP